MRVGRIIVFFLIIIVLAIFSFYYPNITTKAVEDYQKEETYVTRVIDGDTIETDIGTIRLLGINTPERGNYLYEEAKQYLMKIENQSIEVLRDFENKDKYDRKLRYVFFEGDILNIHLVEQGLAIAYMTDDLKYKEKLLRAEGYAKEKEIGLWERSLLTCSTCIELKELNPEEEFFILENDCDLDCNLSGWYVQDASRNKMLLDLIMKGEEKKYQSTKHIWNDNGDSFFLRDKEDRIVIYFSYK